MRTLNQRVLGSNPSVSTIKSLKIMRLVCHRLETLAVPLSCVKKSADQRPELGTSNTKFLYLDKCA